MCVGFPVTLKAGEVTWVVQHFREGYRDTYGEGTREPLGIAKCSEENSPRTWLGVGLRLDTCSHSQPRTKKTLGHVNGGPTQYGQRGNLKRKACPRHTSFYERESRCIPLFLGKEIFGDGRVSAGANHSHVQMKGR